MMRGKHIVIGVTGGIAAYKAVYLVRQLQKTGAEVRVTMTPAATRFVGRETFAALTRHDVPVAIFPEKADDISESWTRHIQWAEWADLVVIAPCTANTLAKIVHGLSDSLLTTTVLAARCPVLICPAMDGEMYQAPSTRANLKKAGEFGYHLLSPEHGYLASGQEGYGRMPEPDRIIEEMHHLLASSSISSPATESSSTESSSTEPTSTQSSSTGSRPDKKTDQKVENKLVNKKVLVTCGATREFLDSVRFLSNPSTGKMGIAMAGAAASFGAGVTLLHAASINTDDLPLSIQTSSFVSTEDLFQLVQSHSDADIIIMTAAVSDFRPVEMHRGKVKKEEAELQLSLERTPDILQWLGDRRTGEQVLIGFAMETEDLAKRAREKRMIKKADWIVANELNAEDSGFAIDTNRVLLVGAHSEVPFNGSKSDVARDILRHIFVS